MMERAEDSKLMTRIGIAMVGWYVAKSLLLYIAFFYVGCFWSERECKLVPAMVQCIHAACMFGIFQVLTY